MGAAADVGAAAIGSSLECFEEEMMHRTIAILAARLIFGGVFVMAAGFKFAGMAVTAGYIASAGFPFAPALAWAAALFESGLAIALLTGAFFGEAAILAAAYVLFLAFAFHGPSHWNSNQAEFGSFVDHFTFIAGLLFAAVHGPGEVFVFLKKRPSFPAQFRE